MGNETNKKGFGGLSDLKTDIDSILKENEVKSTQQSTSKPKEPAEEVSQASSSERKVYQNPQQDNSSKTNPLWWWFIGGVILFLIVAANSNESATTESAPAATEEVAPAAEAMPVDATAPSVEAYSPQEDFYVRPPEGSDNVLSVPQIRYCLADGIKIDAIKTKVDETSNNQIDKLNGLVADHNARCASYRYRTGDDTMAQSDVYQQTTTLKQEAIDSFFNHTYEGTSNDKQSNTSANRTELSHDEQSSIESACSYDKTMNGPAAYNRCVKKQMKKLNTVSTPDLTNLNTNEQSSIESACSYDKTMNGPAAYYTCLNSQLKKLKKSGTTPDMSFLSYDDQSSIESACSYDKTMNGPAAYNRCVKKQLKSLGY